MTSSILSSQQSEDESKEEQNLRPQYFKEYIGQEKVKEKLGIFVTAAQMRHEALDHCLFYGPPGLGKTTLANIVAHELDVGFTSTSGPVIEKPGDLAAILTNLGENDVLFIDEIHRLSRVVEEILYPAMENFNIDIMIGQGPAARSIKLELAHFTLIGATTRAGSLTSPLRDRFGILMRLDFYNEEALDQIVKRSAGIMDVQLDNTGSKEIARRSRGTPRIANRLLRRVRDFAEVKADGKITQEVAAAALTMLEVDNMGFDSMDRKLLFTIIDNFSGGPVGLDTLASAIGEEAATIEDVYEPYLIQKGFLERTPRGRKATLRSFQHLHRSIPNSMKQLNLNNDLFQDG